MDLECYRLGTSGLPLSWPRVTRTRRARVSGAEGRSGASALPGPSFASLVTSKAIGHNPVRPLPFRRVSQRAGPLLCCSGLENLSSNPGPHLRGLAQGGGGDVPVTRPRSIHSALVRQRAHWSASPEPGRSTSLRSDIGYHRAPERERPANTRGERRLGQRWKVTKP